MARDVFVWAVWRIENGADCVGKIVKFISMYNDFEQFKGEISWFVKQTGAVKLAEGTISVNEAFIKTFPSLYTLILSARVLNVTINDGAYKLFSWTTNEGASCGWLCKFEPKNISDIELLPEHQLLLDNMGGIIESYNQPEGAFSNNQNFLFLKSACKRGLYDWTGYYQDMCKDLNITPMKVDDLISFVHEANAAQTLYDLNTKQIYLFSTDHCYNYVTLLPDQPEYTFHYLNGINNFTEYAEALAKQWINHKV